MSNIETLVRDAAPHASRSPEVFLAALAVSEEAAIAARPAHRKRRIAMGVSLAAVLAVSGGAVATAATQSLWWNAPNDVNIEAELATDSLDAFTTVRFIPAAEYADGIGVKTPGAEQAFQLAQTWLADHSFTVDVPPESQTVTDEDRVALPDTPSSIILQDKAQRASEDLIRADIDARGDHVAADLHDYLASNGVEDGLIVVDFTQGVYEVSR